MFSFLSSFLSFFSKHSKGSYIGIVTAIILSLAGAIMAYVHDQNEKLKGIGLNTHSISILQGKVYVLESDSKTHVTQTSFSHYIDHADKERDTEQGIDRSTQKELGELIRGQQDIDRLLYGKLNEKPQREVDDANTDGS